MGQHQQAKEKDATGGLPLRLNVSDKDERSDWTCSFASFSPSQ